MKAGGDSEEREKEQQRDMGRYGKIWIEGKWWGWNEVREIER